MWFYAKYDIDEKVKKKDMNNEIITYLLNNIDVYDSYDDQKLTFLCMLHIFEHRMMINELKWIP